MSKKCVINFTTAKLKKLVDDETSCVTVHTSVYSLHLSPYHLGDISASIKGLLNAKVAKYDKTLNGILLGYKNLKLLTSLGSIAFDSCYINLDIEGDFFIFKPEINSLLTGVVNKTIDNHVGCLVHRLFNVSVPNTNEENWAGNHVSVGDEVILRVGFIDLEARLPYIRSELIKIKTTAKETKNLSKEEKIEDDSTDFQTQDEVSTKKKKKRDKSKSESMVNSLLEENIQEVDTSLKKKNKKSKKEPSNRAEMMENCILEQSNNEEIDTTLKKKNKKSKKEPSNSAGVMENCIQEQSNNEEVDTTLKKKNKKSKKEPNSRAEVMENYILEQSNNEEVDTSLKNKKRKIKKEQSNSAELMENSLFEESNNKEPNPSPKNKNEPVNSAEDPISNNNGSYVDLNLDESLSKKKKKSKNVLEYAQDDKLNNTVQDSENSQTENKKKRKSTQIKNELNDNKSKKGKINMNGHTEANSKNEDIKSLQDSDIIKQIVNFDQLEFPKEKKKRKSKEHKPKKESIKLSVPVTPTLMADAEDRKTKKRKSSFSVVWDNKELDLYDSDLEKTLGESVKPEESQKFNLVKIAALNESNVLKRNSNNSADDFIDKNVKNRKRKSSDKEANGGEQKPKKGKQETKETKSVAVVKKKPKTKVK